MTYPKHISDDRLPLAKNAWWFPYDQRLSRLLGGVLKLMETRDNALRHLKNFWQRS